MKFYNDSNLRSRFPHINILLSRQDTQRTFGENVRPRTTIEHNVEVLPSCKFVGERSDIAESRSGLEK